MPVFEAFCVLMDCKGKAQGYGLLLGETPNQGCLAQQAVFVHMLACLCAREPRQ